MVAVDNVHSDEYAAWLTLAWNNAAQTANSLADQLVTEQQNALALIAGAGGSVMSVGKNSTHQAYSGFNPGSFTQRDITRIFSTLIRYYNQAKAAVTQAFACSADFNNTVPAGYDFDIPVYPLMQDAFAVIAGEPTVLPDLTKLRLPATTPSPGLVAWQ